MSKEVWKTIPGLAGIYEASSLGRIRSNDRVDSMGRFKRGKVLSLVDHGNGYLYFTSSIDGKRRNIYVHRAVVSAFSGVDISLIKVVDHIDCDKKNNRIENLEDVTQKENVRRAMNMGLLVRNNRMLSDEQVKSIKEDKRPQRIIADEHGISQAYVSAIKRGVIYRDVDSCETNIMPKGYNAPNKRLSDDDVRKIRSDKREASYIAEEYGCSRNLIYRVKERRCYNWVS